MSASRCNDASFGPGVEDCSRKFDFTFVFEESILSIVPSVILILVAPLRIIQLNNSQHQVAGRGLQFTKLFAISVFAILQLVLLIFRCHEDTPRQAIVIAAAALSFIDACLFSILSYLEHSRSLRPSALLAVYFFISLLFDIARVRTSWLASSPRPIRGLLTASLGMKFLILLLEAREKRRFLIHNYLQKGPEETIGIFNQGLFYWLNALISTGFSKILLMDDLYPIDEKVTAGVLGAMFRRLWTASRDGGKYSLILTLTRISKWQIIIPIFPRLCLIGFTFCQPLLLRRYLEFLQDPVQSQSIGYGLLGAYAIVYFGLAVSTGFYWHGVYKWITMIRGTLVSAIYQKTTDISITALDDSAAVTLMSTDIDRIELGLRFVHELWASVIQIGVATWLLQREIGLACIAPIVVACLSAAGSAHVARSAGAKQVVWVQAIQKRVGVTSTMLSGMKGVKMSGLVPKLSSLIQQLRVTELADMAAFRMVMIFCAVFAFVPQLISPIITFGTFIGIENTSGRSLDTTRLFTSISLLLLLNQPLAQVFSSFPAFMSSVGCLERIQIYLKTDTKKDHRKFMPEASRTEKTYTLEEEKDLFAKRVSDGLDNMNADHKYYPFHVKDEVIGQSADMVVIRRGAFGWKVDESPILRDINLVIPRTQFTVIVGPIASGKSTLLKAILGETPLFIGSVHCSSFNFSFCDQTPWLLSQTIQDNVVGFSHLDISWYGAVLHSCALDEDIALLPQGDQTRIGSNGISLSGGQKQRLAIARAVYAKKEVAIFDDVFSGLDSTTERHIFERLFGPSGLLRLSSTTIIVATHAVNLLPLADNIVALDKSGTVIEQGSFVELNSRDGSYVHGFSLTGADAKSKNQEIQPDTTLNEVGISSPDLMVEAQDKARQTGDLSVYKYYFSAAGWMPMIIFWTLEITWAFLETFPPVWLKWWSSAIDNNEHPSEGKYLGIYAALQISNLVALAGLAIHVFNIMQVKTGARLHLKTLTTVMAAPLLFFSSTDTGTTLNRFSQDIQLIDGELPNALFDVVGLALSTIGQAILIASASWYILISFPFLTGIFYCIQNYYLRTSRQLRFMDLEAKSPLYTQFIETLSGLATIRAFGWQQANHELNSKLLDLSQRPVYLLYMIQRWLTLVLDFISMGLALIVVGVSLKLKSSVSVGFTGVALVNIISFGQNIKWVVIQWTLLETAIGAVSRTKSFEAEVVSENLPNEKEIPPPEWPSTGLIDIKNLSISYNPESGKNAVEDFDLTIRPGEKIGICGRSGSGKSSLVLALFRLIEISSGSIFIDGLDISTILRQEVRTRLNAIPQDPYFLYGTIRTNLDPWDAQTDDKLIEALQRVELWNVIKTKGGLDTEMEVDFLSHGQRQLFCLARAILRPGKIVVLDEATSSVDRETDDLMQRITREAFAHHTIIAIAHRLDTIIDFDRIVVLKNGKLIECDTPRNLLATDSAFKELYHQNNSKKEGEVQDTESDTTEES